MPDSVYMNMGKDGYVYKFKMQMSTHKYILNFMRNWASASLAVAATECLVFFSIANCSFISLLILSLISSSIFFSLASTSCIVAAGAAGATWALGKAGLH